MLKHEQAIIVHNIQSVLQSQIGNGLTFVDFGVRPILGKGENYGSSIFDAKVKIRRKGDTEHEDLRLIAKMLPASDRMKTFFDNSFKKEVFAYVDLIPTYESFCGAVFDITPKFYGSRSNLKAGDVEVDDEAIILLENLNYKGYYMEDRRKGLDLAHLKTAIQALAKFHAIGFSIKHKKPSYINKIKKYCKPLTFHENLVMPWVKFVLNAIKDDPEMCSYYEKIETCANLEKLRKDFYKTLSPFDPWACVIHGDFWINNVMFHSDKVDDAKIMDFQMYCMSSPLVDILFFLCTSMAIPLQYFDDMLEFYREIMIELLIKYECNAALFEKDSFEARLRTDAVSQLIPIILQSKIVELRESETFEENFVNEYCIKRWRCIVKTFVDKKWL